MGEGIILIPIVVIVVGIVLVVIVISETMHSNNRTRIIEQIEQNNGTVISIESEVKHMNRDTYAYYVRYWDSAGEFKIVRCKINSLWVGDKSIFWDRPISTPHVNQTSTQFQEEQESKNNTTPVRASSKEEIISDLTDEVEQLKLEVEKLKGEDSAENNANTV
jgi:predicted transcriptional regulator